MQVSKGSMNLQRYMHIDSLLTTLFNEPFSIDHLELQKIKDLTEANGDVAFIDAVKHLYYPGHLDYLL